VNIDAVKKYFVKMKKLDKSQTCKRGLGKKRASRWTENLKGRSMQKLETKKYNYPDRLKPEKGDLCKS